jgi:hypothetical protein
MWSGLIEIDHIGFEEAMELPLVEDQEMIQTCSPHAPQKPFTDGIDFSSMMKKAKSERKKRSGTRKKSQAPHPRHLRRMIAQERFPVLSRGSFWTNLPHILLDRPFTHLNIQLEKLTPNALRAPESVICRHLLDQRDRLGGESLPTRGRLRFVLPEHAEELTMPAQKRFGLDKKERLFPGPNHAG